jgi:fucose permease
VLLFLLYTGLEVTVGAWTFSLLTEGRGVESGVAAVWVGGYWAALTGGRLFFGLTGSRWKAHAIVWSMIITGVVGALLFLQPWLPILALLALPILGFACAPLFPLFVSLTPSVVGEAEAPRLIGHQVAAANVGAALIPLLVGIAVEFLSLEAVAYVMLLLTLALTITYPAWIRHSPDSSPGG